MCICEGAEGVHCETPTGLAVAPSVDQRYKVETRYCKDIKMYPGSKGHIELRTDELFELHCYRFITYPTNAVALSFRFGYRGGCIADKARVFRFKIFDLFTKVSFGQKFYFCPKFRFFTKVRFDQNLDCWLKL